MANIGWGELSKDAAYGMPFDTEKDFTEMLFERTMQENFKAYQHAAHGMIYSFIDGNLWNLYPKRATVLMQLRSDGHLGFVGGLIELTDKSIVDGLNRESMEEMNLDVEKFRFQQSDHCITHVNEKKKLVLHFYAMEVTYEDFCTIEKKSLTAQQWGEETYGVLRIPLFTMGDGFRGLPIFLSNKFAGSAKQQFLVTLQRRSILDENYLKTVLDAADKYLHEYQRANVNLSA